VCLMASKMKTLMIAPLAMVTLMMMSPSLSILAWSMGLTLAE
jgi:hypothetical protein